MEEVYKKVCQDCGEVFYAETKLKRKCPECRKAGKSKYAKKYREQYKKPVATTKVKKDTQKARIIINQKQCKTCLYRWQATGSILGCDYMELVGTMRPSEPSPNCKCYKKYNEVERASLVSKQRDRLNRICLDNDNNSKEFRAYRNGRRQ